MFTLAVVIPATDRRQTLQRCLEAIRDAAEAPDETVVVDEPTGMGPAEARNAGARRATSDVLVFVDSDIEVHGDTFQRIRQAFDADPQLAAVFGSYDDEPEGGSAISDFRNLLHHHVHHQGAGPATTFWAGLGAIRREVFLSVGGFDEKRFPRASIEDIELGMRLTAQGSRIALDPGIQGKHLKSWTLRSMIETDLTRRGAPWIRMLLHRGSSSTALNLGWGNRLSVLSTIVLVAAATARRGTPAGAALAALLLLNHSFFRLLARRGGLPLAAAGVPLLMIHQLLAAAAVPAGAALYVRDRMSASRSNSR
jgi:glycosyltransferase involved in cell wall biosynthesis